MADRQELENEGRCWAQNALQESLIVQMREFLDTGIKPGNRLEADDFAAILPLLSPVIEKAQKLLPNCRPVRALVFNKSIETNWAVGWHQDRVIAVCEKHEVNGYSNWTKKTGVWHCEPPIEILENLIFARVHLDASSTDNGCLEVALGSHKNGRIMKKNVPATVTKSEIETCLAKAGDVLFAKALIVHRSKPSRSNSPRLALRIDFSNTDLPAPLEWAL